MPLISQLARISILTVISGHASHSEPKSLDQDSWFFPRAYSRDKQPFFVADRALPFRRLWGGDNVVNRRVRTSSSKTSRGFCPTPCSVFDTRLYSVTGSGLIRRPAALGLLLRFAPVWVPVPPKRNSLQNRHLTPSEFLSVPSGKADLRHLGAGPTPAASPCVTRVNSGIQNGEQKCI